MCQLINHGESSYASQLHILFSLRVFFSSFGDYELEKSILNLSMVMEQKFNTTMQTLKIFQSDINSFDSGVLQNHCVLNIPMAQQRGVYAIITEKCWFYVGQMEQVIFNIYLMKEKISLFLKINGAYTFY